MPMNFPDESLARTAHLHKFRDQKPTETLDEFREALADHVSPIDGIESGEIRYKVGWDQWTDEQKRDHLNRLGFMWAKG